MRSVTGMRRDFAAAELQPYARSGCYRACLGLPGALSGTGRFAGLFMSGLDLSCRPARLSCPQRAHGPCRWRRRRRRAGTVPVKLVRTAVSDGWLYGRGAADCKVAVAIFSHLAADFQQIRDKLRGRLLVLFDADEHTGDFAGVKTFLLSHPKLDGVLIGYPGNYGVIVGARGFYRATITVHGIGGHSGGRQAGSRNAILKAAQLVQAHDVATLPSPTPLKHSHWSTSGSRPTSMPPRPAICCEPRSTTSTQRIPPSRLPRCVRPKSWPPYHLPPRAPIVQAMLDAAHTHHKPEIEPVVCGPSNVGNYFAAHDIDTTCGFGVTYKNLHAPNERIKLNTIQMTSDVYTTAIHSLLASEVTPPNA